MRDKLLFVAAVCLLASSAFAALDISEIGEGARPLGLGRAFVGLADDASAIFTNPAGLGRNNNLNIVSMTGQMMSDANYVMLGAADLSPIGKVGIGFVNVSVGSIPMTTIEGSGASLEVKLRSDSPYAEYNNSLIFLSYGSKLSRFLRNNAGSNFSIGTNLKFMLQGYAGGGTPMQDVAGGGMDADLGLLWDVNNWLNLGLNLKNFLPTSFGGKFVWKARGGNPEIVESIPMTTHAGARFKLIGQPGWRLNPDQKLDLLVDYESYREDNKPATWHIGTEFWPMEAIAFRVGLDQKPKAGESGVGVDNNYSAGIGLNLSGITFDYAYHQFGDVGENATHFFSIGYREGAQLIDKPVRKNLNKDKLTIPVPEIVPKPPLKQFADVAEDFWARKPIEYLATLNIMDGYSDETFRPNKEITRGELAVLLVKAKGFEIAKEVKFQFADVASQAFEAPFISLAVERGYFQGFPDGNFQPESRISRAQMAVVLAKFSGIYVKPSITTKPYADVAPDHWAAPAISADKMSGFFDYLNGQPFKPDAFFTRAEAAEIISKTPFAKKQIEKLISGKNS